jgi:hypothetical protein
MLLQNPQLAYALLQAQVVMRIVDPQVAIVSFILIFTIYYIAFPICGKSGKPLYYKLNYCAPLKAQK